MDDGRDGSATHGASTTLKALLVAGTALLQPPSPLPLSPAELTNRLRASSAVLAPAWQAAHGWTTDDELEEVSNPGLEQRKTQRERLVLVVGRRSLGLLQGMQCWLEQEFWPAAQRDGLETKDFLLGTADLRLVRLLLSHSIASCLLPLTTAYVASLNARSIQSTASSELDTTLRRLFALVETPAAPAAGPSSQPATAIPPTLITQTLTSAHLPPVLLSAFVLGWTPSVAPPTYAALRGTVTRALAALSPTQAVWALGAALRLVQTGRRREPRGWMRPWPAYVEPAISALMSAQLARPGGVRALMDNVLGEATAGEQAADTQKLEHIAAVLSRPPRGTDAVVHATGMLDNVAHLLEAGTPVMHTYAACWTIHHLWRAQPAVVADWLAQRLHRPFLPDTQELQADTVVLPADDAENKLAELVLLLSYAPPSPNFADFLVAPLLVVLFDLYATSGKQMGQGMRATGKAAEAGLVEQAKTLLLGWGKVVDAASGIRGVWRIVSQPCDDGGLGLHWARQEPGFALVYGLPPATEERHIALEESDDAMSSPATLLEQLNFRPDPNVLAGFLRELARDDISSDVFIRVLGEWRVRAETVADPLRTLLFLRFSLAIMETLGEKVVREPQQVLLFVEGVLHDAVRAGDDAAAKTPLVQVFDGTDASPDAEDISKMGLVETAITLLLSVMEGNATLDQGNATILHPIGTHLDALAASSSARIAHLASEAQLVLLVRRSASIAPSTSSTPSAAPPPVVATYRRALALVADPILPVRAHGLSLLSELPGSAEYDLALTPAILDVLAQSLADGESYIYLHAAQALARLVDALGKEVLRKVMGMYIDWGRQGKYDVAVRAGEALDMVLRKTGNAVAANAQLIVPPLAAIFPDQARETVLRTSALSLLTTLAEVSPLALRSWSANLFGAAVDLVQIETVVNSPFRPAPPTARKKVVLVDDEEEPDDAPRTVDGEPTERDSKHPALRRAAVVFLGVLVAGLLEDDVGPGDGDGGFVMRLPGQAAARPARHSAVEPKDVVRARTVLAYVAKTDKDEVVRAQAGEVGTLLGRLSAAERVTSLRGGML
ncbi:hypothetical protein Q5752_003725 [Cryptotrichosporon argae]